MADRVLSRAPEADAPADADVPARRVPWWATVLFVFVASRVVTTVILLVFASIQTANAFSGAHPSYGQLGTYWDGIWYQQIAFFGYPRDLPRDSAGAVTENAWAFLPLYAWLSEGVSILTRLPYQVAAIVVSVLASAGTALVFFRMLSLRLPRGAALWGVTLFCFAPLSPILQVGYAEPVQLLLLATGLLFVMQRRYLWTLPVVLVLGFTRPTDLAFALFLALHLIQRFATRAREPLPRRQVVEIVGAGLFSAVVGLAWPVIAALVTGDLHAYTATELVWRAGYIGTGELVPFTPWVLGADFWLRFALGMTQPVSLIVGLLVVLGALALLALILRSRSARRLGSEPRLWAASYAIYLLAVFFPQTSTFRLLMPMFPLLGALQPRNPVVRSAILVLCVALQVAWVAACWWVVVPDWSPP